MYKLGNQRVESRKRDLGILNFSKLSVCQQCTLTDQRANHALGCPRPSTATGQGEGLCPQLCAVRLHLLHWIRVWVPQYEKGIKPLGGVQRKATEVVKGLEGKIYEEQLRSPGVLRPEQS